MDRETGLSGTNAKDYSYHYLPYKTDSGFERDFFKRTIATAELKSKQLEVYYNGDAPFTEFRIRCCRKVGGIRQSVGQYTPDFLIIQRDKARKTRTASGRVKNRLRRGMPRYEMELKEVVGEGRAPSCPGQRRRSTTTRSLPLRRRCTVTCGRRRSIAEAGSVVGAHHQGVF